MREVFEDKFALYMNNDTKHVSIDILKWYSSCEIETDPSHSHDINPIEKVWGIIKTKFKKHEFNIFD